jgi:sporulation protein YhbH
LDHPIKRDHSRFRKIVKGRVRDNLKKYVSQGQQIIPKGNDKFTIPMPSIEIPRFRFGDKSQGGSGQGDGQQGDPVDGQQDPNGQPGEGEAGEGEGNKELDVEMSLEELASILGEELELPKIEPKGKQQMSSTVDKYTTIGSQGPDSLKHLKRTYKEALKRQVSMGNYDPNNPTVIPIRNDYRYRAADSKIEMENAAVVIYMMDVSGSMGDEQKEIVRTESFWINLWLKSQYKDIEIRYIIHDATAKEVDEETFFRTRESGGTLISSAYKLCQQIIEEDYNPAEWNIYPFHFSDGDNWSADDTKVCMQILDNTILPASNVFCYGQVESRYGSGQFFKDLNTKYGKESEEVILSKIKNKEAILDSIKDFLGKGK